MTYPVVIYTDLDGTLLDHHITGDCCITFTGRIEAAMYADSPCYE